MQVVLERACKAAAERADNDFRRLLEEVRAAGHLTAATTWLAAKPQVTGMQVCPRLGTRVSLSLWSSLRSI